MIWRCAADAESITPATCSGVIDGLLVRHTSKFKARCVAGQPNKCSAVSGAASLPHMDECIEAGALAKIAGRSPFHFTFGRASSIPLT